MRRLESPDWSYFAAAWGIVAVGVGFMVMSSYQTPGLLLTTFGLLMLVYSLRPTSRSLPAVQRLHRWRNQRRKIAEKEQLRRQMEPLLEPWDLFHFAAGTVVARFYELRDSGSDNRCSEGWQSFKEVVEQALSRSEQLQKPDQDHARLLLRCFLGVEQDVLKDCSVAAADLNNWLLRRNTQFFALRQKAGLPGR